MSSPDPIREQSLERSLPNSAESERAVLGGIILDYSLISQAIELLRPEDFYVPSHRRIFITMVGMFEHGIELNPILIGEELKKDNSLESVGGISAITNLTYGLPHSTNIAHYAKVIRGKSLLRQLIAAANKATQAALEQEDPPEIILDNAEAAIFALADEQMRRGFVHIKVPAEEILEKIQEQEGRASVLTGLTTGYADLDRITSGLQKQDFIIVAARPSMGKTSFALMLAENATVLAPGSVIGIFSLEMSRQALASRILCVDANIDAQRFRNGFLSRPEWSQVAKSLGVIGDSKIFVDDTAGIGLLEMRAKARRLHAEQKRLDLLIVDYLQLMGTDSGRRNDSREQEVARISKGLKKLAKELDVPLVVLSQLSRKCEERGDHRPLLADLRESGSLEQDSDVVMFIYRAEKYMTFDQQQMLPDHEKNVAEIIVAKQRNGPTDTVELLWTPSSMRFSNRYRE